MHWRRLCDHNKGFCIEIGKGYINTLQCSIVSFKFADANHAVQIDALKTELETFFGENPLESKDLSRIVNSFHFKRLESMLNEKGVANKIVHGGQTIEEKL